jgi:predicted DNA-binding protein (MmcQ/YjbR family)
MTKRPAEVRHLARLTEICLSLPEASCERHGSHAAYRVRKKVFAYFLDSHHGDGKVAVAFKAVTGENTKLVALDRTRFYLPAYIGPKGWAALRLDTGNLDWDEVAELVRDSFRLVAPKRLAALLSAPPP